MLIHPELRALRDDDGPQRQAQAALIDAVGAWRQRPHVAGLLADLAALDKGAEIAARPALAALFTGASDTGSSLADEVASLVAAVLRENPLGHVPFRHFADEVIATLQLVKAGNVTLSLVAIDGEGLAKRPAATTVDFSPSEVWEHVLAGSARAAVIDRGKTTPAACDLRESEVKLAPGTVIVRDARRRSMQLREVAGRLVSLRLQRREAGLEPTREYDLVSGRLVHQAAGNPRDSRLELMMALLGRMGRADAAPVMAAMSRERISAALRWQALRECLALDSAAGFAALTQVAQSIDDELAPAAGALRSQLIETYPQLQELVPCPA